MPHVDLNQRPKTPYEKLQDAVIVECAPTHEIDQITRALWGIESDEIELQAAMTYWDELRDTPRPTSPNAVESAVFQYREYRKKLVMGDDCND
jgi:hypothetical protein